ncbi:GntR family transcriptional regulator [Streptomyces flaveolus]|uniref:GntR family transcriptional regulator n=1 Tax=Streptomyces flaveolus TaxID=67297 RepID=UPI00343745D0
MTEERTAAHGGGRRTPQEVADILRERIRSGALRAGDRMPTQAELAEEFGVERGAVRQALRALQEDGLLSDVRKGSPSRVVEPGPVREEPQQAMVALAPRLTEAFAAPHVRIDVRILLPSRDISLAFPVSVGAGDDDAVHQRWLAMRNAQGQVLRHNLQALRGTHSLPFSFERRAGQRDAAFVEQSQKWFDALWETIPTDLTLS